MPSDRLVLAAGVLLAMIGASGCTMNADPASLGITSQALCDDSNPCTRDTPLPHGPCTHVPLVGMNCDDGNACTAGDRCTSSGQCRGSAGSCDDGDECTDDRCDPVSGCVFTASSADTPCDDHNTCTIRDHCDGNGACVGAMRNCDDGNDCTVDTCRDLLGCVHIDAAAGTPCEDGNRCTERETCNGHGRCMGGTAVACDDGNPCTTDRCLPAVGCRHANRPAGVACDDRSACTSHDRCDGQGACVGQSIACSDGNDCTTDGCDSSTGCTFLPSPSMTPCDDYDACTTNDRCDGAGACRPGGMLLCSDGNPCTEDVCRSDVGCVFNARPPGSSCNDATLCTTGDVCMPDGSCIGTPVSCDDGNPCTIDGCDPASGCTRAPAAHGTVCDDANACTVGDQCDGSGACVGGHLRTCSDGDACTTDSCDPSAGCVFTAVSCDDGNECTTDECDHVLGCWHAPRAGAPCSDGDPCTGPDVCSEVAVCRGPAHVEDDQNPCTLDTCTPGVGMNHTPLARGASCGDDDPANGDEVCDGQGHCLAGVSAEPVAPFDDNAIERRIDGRHPVASTQDAFAVVFSEPAHRDGSPPRLGVSVRSSLGQYRGTAWIDDVTMTPHASVAALPDGNFVVVFESRALGSVHDDDGLGIGAIKVSSQGALLGSVHLVNATTLYSQHTPDVVGTASGAMVAWEDESQNGMRRICWRALSSSLGASGAEQCDGQPGMFDGFVTLAALGTHTAMAWQREASGTGSVEVRIDYHTASLPLTSEAGPLPVGEAPAVSALDANTLLVAYTDGDGFVRGWVLADDATELDAVDLAAAGEPRQQLSASGSLLVWQEPAESGTGGWDDYLDEVYLQQLEWSGAVLDTAAHAKRPVPRAEGNRTGDQDRPAIALLGDGWVVAWQDLQASVQGRCPHGDVLVSIEHEP